MRGLLQWVDGTAWSIALRESLYVWPLVESTHVLAIALFVGTAIMNDLRLMGVSFHTVPASAFTDRLLRWTRIGFVIVVVTGLLIFYSQPVRYYHNVFFRLKMIVMVVAALNIWLFHGRIHRRIAEWDHDPVPPRSARMAGAVSLVAWSVVVVSGRMIAYNWFDCDIQPQPAWVNWAAGCVLPGE